ncbi:hypothetical protein PanWU01x14_071350, partial [Parasponia andersonii]
ISGLSEFHVFPCLNKVFSDQKKLLYTRHFPLLYESYNFKSSPQSVCCLFNEIIASESEEVIVRDS